LRLALTAHSAISIPPESPFMIRLHRQFGGRTVLDAASAAAFVKALDQEPNALARRWQTPMAQLIDGDDLVGMTYPDACALLYKNYAHIHDSTAYWWGDKNNPFHHHIPTLCKMYPQARFVHLIRDGRAVLASAQQLATIDSSSSYFPKLAVDAVTSAANWVHGVHEITRQLSRCESARWRQVRYEDLVADFEVEMQPICTMLDVSYESAMMNFDVANRNRSLEPSEYDAWKSRTRDPLTTERAEAWKSGLSSADSELYASLTRVTLERFGYETASPRPSSAADRVRFASEVQKLKLQSIARGMRASARALR